MSDVQSPILSKDAIINNILNEDDLYKIVGAPRTASQQELRRCYLERSKVCHPDRGPPHALSTAAFQRLGFAFDILKSPPSRRSYDQASHPSPRDLPDKTSFLGGEETFRTAVLAILADFMTGDFPNIKRFLDSLHARYPNLIPAGIVRNVLIAFMRLRQLVITTGIWGLIVCVELGRVNRVRRKLMDRGWCDVFGRARLSVHLVKVAIAIPVRVDRKMRERNEKAKRAEMAGLQASGLEGAELDSRAGGILNEHFCKVLEFIVGDAGRDEGADERWAEMVC